MISAALKAQLKAMTGLTYYLYGSQLYAFGATRENCRKLRRLGFKKDSRGEWCLILK